MLRKILYILSEKKRNLALLLVVFNAASLLELLGIGLIFPYMVLITDPGAFQDTRWLKGVTESFGIGSHAQLILVMSVLLVVVYALKNVVLFFMQYHTKRYIYSVLKRLRDRLFRKYLYAPYEFHLQRNSNVLISNINNEAQRFAMTTVEQSLVLVSETLFLTFVAIALFVVSPLSIVVLALLGLFIFLFYRYTRSRTFEYGRIGTESNAQLMCYSSQGILSLRTTKIHKVEDYFCRRVAQESQRQLDASARFYSLLLLPRFTIEVLLVAGFAGMVSYNVLAGRELTLAVPLLATLAAAAVKVMPSVNKVVTAISSIKNSEPTVNVVYDELRTVDALLEERQDADARPIAFENEIDLVNIGFGYDTGDIQALQDVNVRIRKGQAVGVIGPSGAGKSTLVDILLGLLGLKEGDIRVDGQSIRNRIGAWQRLLGYVPQMIYLLDESVRSNIAFGIDEDSIDEAALNRAVKAASLEDVIRDLPEGLDTLIGENGVRLSGGQRQRVGIARALYKDPEILILDEATSALDDETERVISEAIDSLSHNKTLIIIAHRLTTLKNCDVVYRLEGGQVVDVGTYTEIVGAE